MMVQLTNCKEFLMETSLALGGMRSKPELGKLLLILMKRKNLP